MQKKKHRKWMTKKTKMSNVMHPCDMYLHIFRDMFPEFRFILKYVDPFECQYHATSRSSDKYMTMIVQNGADHVEVYCFEKNGAIRCHVDKIVDGTNFYDRIPFSDPDFRILVLNYLN